DMCFSNLVKTHIFIIQQNSEEGMRKRTKGLIVVSILLIILVPTAFYVLNLLYPPRPEPFDLDNAPAEIIAIKIDLKTKLSEETFSWSDMDDFITISQYIADNSPMVKELIQDWDRVTVFDVVGSGYFWFTTMDDSMIIQMGYTPPTEYDAQITLTLEAMIQILSQKETAISSFQKGNLDFTGPLGDALKIDRITQIIASTLMDTSIDFVESSLEFIITQDQPALYDQGLTLMPCTEIIIENGSSTFGNGHLVVLDQAGRVVAQLDDTLHWVHKFINSTTVLMGGAGGNAELWNYQTGVVEALSIPGGHHELDYNPATDTFLVLEDDYSSEIWDGRYVLYDVLSEYSRNGDLIWQWDGRDEYPFNSTIHTGLGLNETFRAGADWMHSNSFTWDKENDVIYLNVRNQDTILKIDKSSKNIVWAAGRWGNFRVLNSTGHEVDSIFYHPHSLEWIGSDRFIIYDNDFYNPNHPTTMVIGSSEGYSRLVEFVIDEDNQTMREVWFWDPQNVSYYFQDSGGDADRLPNGNTIGIFATKALTASVPDPVIITEVTQSGEVAWELQVPGANKTYYWTHRLERFYPAPLIHVDNESIELDLNAGTLSLNLTTWNSYKIDSKTSGTLKVIVNGDEYISDSFEFQTHWQPNNFEISLTDLSSEVDYIQIKVANDEGQEGNLVVYGVLPNPPLIFDLVLPVAIGLIIIVPVVIIILVKKGKLNLRKG
ncbi:MAG: aryl-sulfate sulfotransferase, partial [Candidatus Sifarchaeia archaeon]